MLTLTSLGGAATVTGSKHLLELDGRRLLVDCGMFQGLRELKERNWQPLPISAKSIEAVILTHAHLDHSGYLPRLVREGFTGPIYASAATIDVVRLILLDSAHLQEKDAEFANRHGFSRHQPALPLYTTEDAEQALAQFRPVPFHQPFDLGGGASLLLRHAGHILGAATAEIHLGGERLLFSGDLGRYDDPILPDPEPVTGADYLVIESTYGDRLHPHVDPTEALGDAVERTVQRGGTVVVPAFAIGRAQALLYYLSKLRSSGRLGLVPVYVDSPMATNATDLIAKHLDDQKLSAEAWHEACAIATYVRDVEGSKALSANRMPKVIISSSGMATGGRVQHHIKAFAPDPRNMILLTGYQAAGTPGRALADGAHELKIHGQLVPVHAEVAELSMLSAHADASEILRWLGGFSAAPRKTFIVHGEPDSSEALKQKIEGELGWPCVVQQMGAQNALEPGTGQAASE